VESRINPSVSAGGCDVQIYPNPVFLSSGGPGLEVWIGRDFHGETTACLYNVLGQEMLRARWDRNVSGLSYRIPLDRSLAQLKTGVYLLRVTNSDQSVVKKLHVIQ